MGDWWQIVLQFIGAIFGGGGIVGLFMFFKSRKRTESANASKAENEVESMRIDNKKKNYDVQDGIITDLLSEFKEMTSKFVELTKSNTALEKKVFELDKIAESNKKKIEQLTNERCTVENCDKRQPPRILSVKECTNCKAE